jgi:hypothetical protein
MEAWLIPVLSLVIGIVGGLIGAHVGVKVAIASLSERMRAAEQEIVMLRAAKHDHAQFLTRHELDLEYLKMRVK